MPSMKEGCTCTE